MHPDCRSSFRKQATQAEIINYILHFLDTVLDTVTALTENIVLEVENLKASMNVLDELADL